MASMIKNGHGSTSLSASFYQDPLIRKLMVYSVTALGMSAILLSGGALAQRSDRGAGPPSNARLASPAIERRVDELMKKMTLEEKLVV